MRCFVTGASGFIGANLVHALNSKGHEVRALLRPKCDLRGLAEAAYEPVFGNLDDKALLRKAARGCDARAPESRMLYSKKLRRPQ